MNGDGFVHATIPKTLSPAIASSTITISKLALLLPVPELFQLSASSHIICESELREPLQLYKDGCAYVSFASIASHHLLRDTLLRNSQSL
jgi:hypothetical protein